MSPDRKGPTPFGRIALSFSGGGGRAAGFHLGTLVYLDRLDILEDVSILSTVSGGSFVGASYALALKLAPEGEDRHTTFRNYYDSFTHILETAQLLPWALQHMAKGTIDVPSGRHNLVTALAQVYDDTFLKQARFGVFWEGREIHLRELIFNATEFKTGAAFRFQKSDFPCVIGNSHVSIDAAHARQMRLADVVACSSCIPVGLEPLMFPDDFNWPQESPQTCAEIKAGMMRQCGAASLPIMDGGVYDNQGIESALLAVRRDPRHAAAVAAMGHDSKASLAEWFQPLLASPEQLGTFIVSDAPLRSDEGLATAEGPRHKGLMTLRRLDLLTHLLMASSVLTVTYMLAHLALSTNQLRPLAQIDDFFAYGLPIVLAVLLFFTLLGARKKVRQLLNAFPQTGESSWQDIRQLTLTQVVEMMKIRLSSTWALTSWVYFNRIRQLGFDLLRALPGAKRHLIAHEIADLMVVDETLPAWLRPSAAAQDLARRASSLSTQLWFDKKQDLENVVACGRITLCFNILRHLERNFPTRTPEQQRVYERARADWAVLQADPMAVLPAEVATA